MMTYYRITGILLLALMVVQLTGINCIDKDDIPFSDDVEQSLALIHTTQTTSIDGVDNHDDEDTSLPHGCPCHFQFIPNPSIVSTGTSVGLAQLLSSYDRMASILPQRISKPPRLL